MRCQSSKQRFGRHPHPPFHLNNATCPNSNSIQSIPCLCALLPNQTPSSANRRTLTQPTNNNRQAPMSSSSTGASAAGASFLVLVEEEEEDEASALSPSSSSSSAVHVPEFDWVQVRETWGALRLYRHAPLDSYGSSSGGGGNRAPQQQQPRQGLLLGNQDKGRPKTARHGSTMAFRPARLSTVLLLDCRAPPSPGADGGTGGRLSAKVWTATASPAA